jgi:hypothetical protein
VSYLLLGIFSKLQLGHSPGAFVLIHFLRSFFDFRITGIMHHSSLNTQLQLTMGFRSSHPRRIPLLLLTCISPCTQGYVNVLPSHRTSHGSFPCARKQYRCHTVSLRAADDNDSSKMNGRSSSTSTRSSKSRGVYSRPSGAIERGSGFFVPGLEGPKVRLAVGLVLMVATVVNHSLAAAATAAADVNPANTFAESLAGVYSILVLLQAAIEYTKEMRGQIMIPDKDEISTLRTKTKTKTASLSQQWSMQVDDQEWRKRVEWMASLYLSLTPATHVMLVGPGKILYWLGSTSQPSFSEAQEEGSMAALKTVSKSKGGRVSLPDTHPAVTSLAPEQHSRCVVLQRIDDSSQLALMITSDQLLPSFTKQDLQWLGQLALYVRP